MKLIVGLGNPSEEYAKTRHNAGFMFIDYLYSQSEIVKPWKFDRYANSDISQVMLQGYSHKLQAILAKPQTFMNKSGITVVHLAIKHQIQPSDCYIAHDDLDIKLGEFKISLGKGPKLHNGTKSIEELWKTKEFWRIRIGVDSRTESIPGETYVLQNFRKEEFEILNSSFPTIMEFLNKN